MHVWLRLDSWVWQATAAQAMTAPSPCEKCWRQLAFTQLRYAINGTVSHGAGTVCWTLFELNLWEYGNWLWAAEMISNTSCCSQSSWRHITSISTDEEDNCNTKPSWLKLHPCVCVCVCLTSNYVLVCDHHLHKSIHSTVLYIYLAWSPPPIMTSLNKENCYVDWNFVVYSLGRLSSLCSNVIAPSYWHVYNSTVTNNILDTSSGM